MVWLKPKAKVLENRYMQNHHRMSYEAYAFMDNIFARDVERDKFLKKTVCMIKGGHVFSDEDMKHEHLSLAVRCIERALQGRIMFAILQKKELLLVLGSIETTERASILDEANQEIERCVSFVKLFERQFPAKFGVLVQMLHNVKEDNEEEEIDDESIASTVHTEDESSVCLEENG